MHGHWTSQFLCMVCLLHCKCHMHWTTWQGYKKYLLPLWHTNNGTDMYQHNKHYWIHFSSCKVAVPNSTCAHFIFGQVIKLVIIRSCFRSKVVCGLNFIATKQVLEKAFQAKMCLKRWRILIGYSQVPPACMKQFCCSFFEMDKGNSLRQVGIAIIHYRVGCTIVNGQWIHVHRKFTLESNVQHFMESCFTSFLYCEFPLTPNSCNFSNFT